MIETRRLKNIVIFFPNNYKFCAIEKNYSCFPSKLIIIITIKGMFVYNEVTSNDF